MSHKLGMQITYRSDPNFHPDKRATEIVERKGIGHPDTLADGIAELASIKYCEYCLKEFGFVLHHNLDKVGVVGGRARFDWESGIYDRPLRVVFGGRASTKFGNKAVPVVEILEAAALEQLRHALPGFRKVPVQFIHLTSNSSMYNRWFEPETEADLPELRAVRSNDTAFLVGIYPPSRAETIALMVEAFFIAHEWAGTDIKVLVVREGNHFDITCNVPILVGSIHDYHNYRKIMSEAKQTAITLLRDYGISELAFRVRALDDTSELNVASPQDCYLNICGSAIDYGEEGLVGRGNSRHGLVSPAHGAGNEAVFGKNPTYQVGKVGALIADSLAESSAQVGGGAAMAQVAYRRGAGYDSPFFCVVTTKADIDPTQRRLIDPSLDPSEWLRLCVLRQRYRPVAPKLVQFNTKTGS